MEDHIRNLCVKLIESDKNSEEFKAIASELRACLSEHITRIRTKLRHYPVATERRSSKG